MKTPDHSLPAGYVLQGQASQYVIQQKLGQGAFGITYLAETQVEIHGNMGTGTVSALVAVKEFFMHELNSRDESTSEVNDLTGNSLVQKYRASFLREANHMATLSKKHPSHIVQIIEVFEANNTAYIVMQYLKGGNLDDRIKAKGYLTEDVAMQIFSQICVAIRFMHDNRMLHLDLKPKNVMFDDRGNAKIIDFGLSKQYNDTGEAETSTTIGLGTPGYAPNEQSEKRPAGAFPVTLDIYALGATLYKMLTGMTPPLASKVLDNPQLIADSLASKGVSDVVIALVVKCMSPASSKRYQTIDELMNGLPEESTLTVYREKPSQSESRLQTPAEGNTKKAKKSWIVISALAVCIAIGYLMGGVSEPGRVESSVNDSMVSDTLESEDNAIADEIIPSQQDIPSETDANILTDEESENKVASKPTPEVSISRKILILEYATWEGEVRNGMPYGEGKMTYRKESAIGDESHTKAQEGDVIEGIYQNGRWIGFPRITFSDGRKKTLAM